VATVTDLQLPKGETMIGYNLLRYDLQFFAEDKDNGGTDNTDKSGCDNTTDTSTDDNDTSKEIDPSAFADLISEKDKEIQQLQKDITELKKSNAMLTVRVNAGQKLQEFDTEKAILEFCDTRKLSK
jgi:hypothetical protein